MGFRTFFNRSNETPKGLLLFNGSWTLSEFYHWLEFRIGEHVHVRQVRIGDKDNCRLPYFLSARTLAHCTGNRYGIFCPDTVIVDTVAFSSKKIPLYSLV